MTTMIIIIALIFAVSEITRTIYMIKSMTSHIKDRNVANGKFQEIAEVIRAVGGLLEAAEKRLDKIERHLPQEDRNYKEAKNEEE